MRVNKKMSRAKTITLDYRDFLQGPYQIQVPEGYKRIQLNAFSMIKNEKIENTNWLEALLDYIDYQNLINIISNRINEFKRAEQENRVDEENLQRIAQTIYVEFYKNANNVLVDQEVAEQFVSDTFLPWYQPEEFVNFNVFRQAVTLVESALDSYNYFNQFIQNIENFGLFRSNQFSIKGFIPINSNYLVSSELDDINDIAKEIYFFQQELITKFVNSNRINPVLSTDSIKLHIWLNTFIVVIDKLFKKMGNFSLPKKIIRLSQSSPLYDRYVKLCPDSVYLNIEGINSWRNTAALFNGEPFILGMQGNTFELCSPTLIISMNDIEGNYFNASSAFIQFTFI